MLFSSFEYIILYLPVVLGLYFILGNLFGVTYSQWWLILSSLFFYSYWNPDYLPLILISVSVNYLISCFLLKQKVSKYSSPALVIGILFNLSLLGYYKYSGFLLVTINDVIHADFPVIKLLLPLAISFFTFQQIGFLVDSRRGKVGKISFREYFLFVSFFPQLIAGPIVQWKNVIWQFRAEDRVKASFDNLKYGFLLFSLGLFKKIVIADTFSVWANQGFHHIDGLTFSGAWVSSLAFTIQLYYDFSGYCDMALGSAKLFNIDLPMNFNSPYKSHSIQDFWRRWHISLGTFFKDYLYIPLGGNRGSYFQTLRNAMIVFTLCGLWHGAGLTFLIWGGMHGFAMIVCTIWQRYGFRLSRGLGWLCTFFFVNLAWVMFKSPTLGDALRFYEALFGWPVQADDSFLKCLYIVAILLVSFLVPNSSQIVKGLNRKYALPVTAFIYIFCFLQMLNFYANENSVSEFLYFNF